MFRNCEQPVWILFRSQAGKIRQTSFRPREGTRRQFRCDRTQGVAEIQCACEHEGRSAGSDAHKEHHSEIPVMFDWLFQVELPVELGHILGRNRGAVRNVRNDTDENACRTRSPIA